MVRSAPRYPSLILDAVSTLDDRDQPIAETCRRIGERAEAAGLKRPSYVHLRRLIHAHRDRTDALGEITKDAAGRFLTGRYVDPYLVLDRIEVAARRPRYRL